MRSMRHILVVAVVGVLFLVLVWHFLGAGQVIEETALSALEMAASTIVALLSLVAIVICLPRKTLIEEAALGQWRGERFIYHERQRVFTTEWSPADNGSCVEFTFFKGEPGTLVDYEIEVGGRSDLIQCAVIGAFWMEPIQEMVGKFELERRGRVILGRKRQLRLICNSAPNSLPSIVTVYVVAWETNHDVLMEYTDARTQTRCEIRR